MHDMKIGFAFTLAPISILLIMFLQSPASTHNISYQSPPYVSQDNKAPPLHYLADAEPRPLVGLVKVVL